MDNEQIETLGQLAQFSLSSYSFTEQSHQKSPYSLIKSA